LYPVLGVVPFAWGFPYLLGGFGRFGILGLFGAAYFGISELIEGIKRIKKF
jgi:hypothetical protein